MRTWKLCHQLHCRSNSLALCQLSISSFIGKTHYSQLLSLFDKRVTVFYSLTVLYIVATLHFVLPNLTRLLNVFGYTVLFFFAIVTLIDKLLFFLPLSYYLYLYSLSRNMYFYEHGTYQIYYVCEMLELLIFDLSQKD